MTRRAAGTFQLVALAVTSFVAGCASPPRDAHPSTLGVGAAAVSAERAPDSPARAWHVGRPYGYRLKVTSTLDLAVGAHAFDFDMTGTLRLLPVEIKAESATLYATIADVQILSRVPEGQKELDKTAEAMRKTGCAFTLSAGRLVDLLVPKSTPPLAFNTCRLIASSLQFAKPTTNEERYSAEEYDTTGKYLAEYEIDADHQSWHRRKQRYVALFTPKNASVALPSRLLPQVVESSATIRLTSEGRPRVVDMNDQIVMNGAQAPVRSSNALSLQSDDTEPDLVSLPDWSSLVAGMVRVAADEPFVTEGLDESLDQARIGGWTFEKVVSRMGQLEKARAAGSRAPEVDDVDHQKQVAEESKLFIALSAIFRARPETIPLAVERIRRRSYSYHSLVGALSSASTPAAQKALVDLVESKSLDPLVRAEVLTALSRTSRPDAVSIAMLKGMLVNEPFSTQAIYGLGTFARRLRDAGQTEQAKEIGDLLIARLALGYDSGTLGVALRGIANSGYDGALSHVRPHLTSADESVRVAAVRALQSMRDPAVDELIAARLEGDAAVQVRLSAIEAAKVRQPSVPLSRGLASAARYSDPHVRYRAVELLATWLSSGRTDVRPTIEVVAQTDDEPRVRELAQHAL